uniref:Lipocalin/cytosolic fatty-acid binding domain-containing protein n=1 Tax=Homalodisca liturata TaxID=320908 RepID=A0A1B6IZE7_9HEMI
MNIWAKLVVVASVILTLLPITASSQQPVQGQHFSKCDPKIIKNMHRFWAKAGTPNVEQLITMGTFAVVNTTYCVYPPDIRCVAANLYPDTASMVWEPDCGEPERYSYQVEYAPGMLIDKDSGLRWFYAVITSDGYIAFYKCDENGPPGKPAGGVMVPNGHYNKERVCLAAGVLSLLHIWLQENRDYNC